MSADPDSRLRRSSARLRGAGGRIWRGFLMLLMLPIRGGGFLARQLRGLFSNLRSAWAYLTFDNILPPSLVGVIQWVIETIPKLAGVRDTRPWEQFGAALSVIGVAILATFLSGGLLIGTVILVGALGLVGLIRLVPAVNRGWNRATGALPIKRDYDVARWRRD